VRRPSSGSTMTRAPLAALVLTTVCLGVPVGCGSSEEPLAKVDGTRIEREDVESLIELYKSRAEAREGEAEEKGKEKVSHPQEVGALQVLVQRAALEQKARQLGVNVDEHAVEELAERLEGPESAQRESEQPTGEEEEGLRNQIRETARAQLLLQALHRRVTRDVRVSHAAVIAYYRSHRSSYPTPPASPGSLPPPTVARAIRRGLTATARDKAMARFLARVQREIAPKVEYREGWSPQKAQR
jgi:hypothetical protein